MKNTNVRVDLRIMGDEYNIDTITKSLHIAPTKTWNNGEYIKETKRKRTYTAWIYSTGVEETLDINTQILKIQKLFMDHVTTISQLKNQYNLDISIDVVIVIENEEPPAIYLDFPIIQFAYKIGARFDIDTYVN